MTFLCGPEQAAGVPHSEYAPGQHGWPKPWALRCNECGAVFDYGTIGTGVGSDVHVCGPCRRGEHTGQLAMAFGA